jgi:hypothetical protein
MVRTDLGTMGEIIIRMQIITGAAMVTPTILLSPAKIINIILAIEAMVP